MAISNSTASTLQTNADLDGKAFSIEMTAKSFGTVVDDLYSNIPLALARETISNMDDAHRLRDARRGTFVAGYQTSVYAPKLHGDAVQERLSQFTHMSPVSNRGYIVPPTQIVPQVTFVDVGVGLSVEQIMGDILTELNDDGQPVIKRDEKGRPMRGSGLYTTLFKSTKTNTNNAVGEYGLGCKVPCAIADAYTIISRQGGLEHQYLIYMSDGMPKVSWKTKCNETGEPRPRKTDEYDGVEVIVPIPMDEVDNTRAALQKVLSTIPEHAAPEMRGDLEITRISKNIRYGNTFIQPSVDDRHYAIQGSAHYPIDTDHLPEYIRAALRLVGTTYTEFNIGELRVPPAREGLTYDRNTKAALIRRLKGVVSASRDIRQSEFNAYIQLITNRTSNFNDTFSMRRAFEQKWGDKVFEEMRRTYFKNESKLDKMVAFLNWDDEYMSAEQMTFTKFELKADSVRSKKVDNRYIYGLNVQINDSHLQKRLVVVVNDMNYPNAGYMKYLYQHTDVMGTAVRRYRLENGTMMTVIPKDSELSRFQIEEKVTNSLSVLDADRHIDFVFASDNVMTRKIYNSSQSAGIAKYNGGVAKHYDTWGKVTADDMSIMFDNTVADLKPWVYVNLEGYVPDVSITDIKLLNDLLDKEKYQGIVGIRKTGKKAVKDVEDKLISFDDVLNEILKSTVTNNRLKEFVAYFKYSQFVGNCEKELTEAHHSLMMLDCDIKVPKAVFLSKGEGRKTYMRQNHAEVGQLLKGEGYWSTWNLCTNTELASFFKKIGADSKFLVENNIGEQDALERLAILVTGINSRNPKKYKFVNKYVNQHTDYVKQIEDMYPTALSIMNLATTTSSHLARDVRQKIIKVMTLDKGVEPTPRKITKAFIKFKELAEYNKPI